MISWRNIFVAILITLLNYGVTVSDPPGGGGAVRTYSFGHK